MKKELSIMMIACTMTAMVACSKKDNNTENPSGGNTSEWIDLGLPSGLLWAKCNLGSSTPEGYGNYYAWGETQPKEAYDWGTYHYCTVDGEGNLLTLTKYNTDNTYGTPDNLTTLQAMDDAAQETLGSGARIPSKEEWTELVNNTTVEWTTIGGVSGRKFTATNGNTLFLPSAGYRFGTELVGLGEGGGYWSSSLFENDPSRALGFGLRDCSTTDGGRNYGQSVRPVRLASQN